ncbi:MAG: hypothetical protein M1823_006134 [Watsoniomyces obsoletus]|nr:MAG: hypothetical protein M1823_006134 [Watsoniomyces obsoletus]
MDVDIDDEAPPDLVDTGTMTSENDSDPSLVKVPITIVTEFGDSADIEKALTINQDGQKVQEWLELANGCICCSVKFVIPFLYQDSGVAAIESLMLKRGSFDYILLETTGLANPGNIAPMFWLDDELGSSIYLDGIVTVVDARNILHYLESPPSSEEGNEEENRNEEEDKTQEEGEEEGVEGNSATIAHLQISHADIILVNKSDMVHDEHLEKVKERIHGINGLAKVHVTSHGRVEKLEGMLLDLHAYDGEDGTLWTLGNEDGKKKKKEGVIDSVR